jgi:hypothetical protein
MEWPTVYRLILQHRSSHYRHDHMTK